MCWSVCASAVSARSRWWRSKVSLRIRRSQCRRTGGRKAMARTVSTTTPSEDRPRHASRAIWIAAALGALTLHAGGAAVALGSLWSHDSDDDLGAPAIEIGVELTSPQLDPTNLPVGPDTDASAPSPAVVEQKEVVEKTDLPKAV